MSDSVRPQRWQPTRLPRPWDSPGKNTGVGCHLLLQCMKVKSESEVAQLCPTLSNPWTAAHQAPLSIGFSRQEYWSGVPLPSLSFLLIKHYFSLIFFIVSFQAKTDLSVNCNFQKSKKSGMAPHSSTLAWKIRWTEEPGGLPSMGSHRVGHD